MNFLGIGVPKCGTTWIYENLKKHPKICVSQVKETDFFTKNREESDLKEYKQYFNHCSKDKIKGEYSVNYFHDERAPERISDFFPNNKLILSLRNPVDREISEYFHNLRHIGEISEERANNRLKTLFKGEKNYYSYYLKKWLDYFEKEQFHIILMDDVKENPKQVLSNLYNFLDVDSDFVPDNLDQKSNTSHSYTFPKIQGKLANVYSEVKTKPKLNKFLENSGIYGFGKWVKNLNSEDFDKPKVYKDTRKQIYNCFKKDIAELEDLIDKDLSVWKLD